MALEQRRKLVVQFASNPCDLGRVEAAELGARLVEGEPRGPVGVFDSGRTQTFRGRCVQLPAPVRLGPTTDCRLAVFR
jgi:hypothetical protein